MTKRMGVVLILACVTAVWATQSKPPQAADEQQKSIEKAVLEVHAKMLAAEKSRDADKFFEFIPDFDTGLIIQDGAIYKTRKEALDAVKMGFQAVAKIDRKFDQTYVTVLSPQVALLTSAGTITATMSDGQTITRPFASSVVFALRDGQWKLVQGHYSTPTQR